MNRFTTALTKLDTLPSQQDAAFWYRTALMDIKIALLGNAYGKDFETLMELHAALSERYKQAQTI